MIRHVAQEARANPSLAGLAAVERQEGLRGVAVKPFFLAHSGAVGWLVSLRPQLLQ